MTVGAFWNSYDEAISLLKDLNLLKEDNRHKDGEYSKECKDYSRSTEYRELYQKLIDNRDFDIQLCDDSLLQLSISNGESRLLYIQNPLSYMSFEEFLERIDIDYTPEVIDEYKGLLSEEYEKACEGMKINGGAVYLRYDVDSRGRENSENIHAYTHLHIGLNNNIRIPVGIHLTPLAFIMFVIRHVYYDTWVEVIRESKIDLDFKSHCTELPAELWTEAEKKFLHIS